MQMPCFGLLGMGFIMAIILTMSDPSGSRKSNMAATKPEILINQFVEKIARKL